MSEENYDEIANENEITAEPRNRKPIYIVIALIVVALIGGVLYWTLSSREGGRTVSAPTGVTFGNNTGTPGETTGLETVTILPDQVEKIGLKIETVGETLSSEAMSVAATGVVQADAYKESPIFSLVGGVVRKVNQELGNRVDRGQTVAVVSSEEISMAEANFLSLAAAAEEGDKRYKRALKLTDIAQESRTELDQAAAAVRIAEAEHATHVSHFDRTEKLVKIGAASREEFESIRSMHETAKAKLEEAKKRLERAKLLLEINPQRRAELDAALTQKRTSEANLSAEREKLLVLGVSAAEIERVRSTGRVSAEVAIRSPVSGTLTTRAVNSGEAISANKELMRITDLSTVWVIAQVYEKDLASLRAGSGASVTTDAYAGRLFRGHVTYIDPNIDQATRTAQVRVELENPGQILKIGMYVNVAFGSMGAAELTMPTIPSTAVQNLNDRKVVFVPTDRPNVFAIKTVQVGAEANGIVTILQGLNVGDRVVTAGSFLLRAEHMKQTAF